MKRPKFQQRHYEVLAEILREEKDGDNSMETFVTVHNIADQMSDYFERDNIHFDRERFLIACDVYIEEDDE